MDLKHSATRLWLYCSKLETSGSGPFWIFAGPADGREGSLSFAIRVALSSLAETGCSEKAVPVDR